MRGQYRLWLPQPTHKILSPHHWLGEPDLIVPNLIPAAAEEDFLLAIVRDSFTIAGGGNFYVGLCNQTPNNTDVLTDISSEPSSAGGYSRKAITRDATGWPTVVTVNGAKGVRSATVTFTAASANFSAAIARAFLTDQASGTTGDLYSISGATTAPITVEDGQSLPLQYELFMR